MSETWQVAVVGGVLSLMTMVLACIASVLSDIRKDLGDMVRKHDCERDMDSHCSLINELSKRVQQNSIDIAVLQKQDGGGEQ